MTTETDVVLAYVMCGSEEEAVRIAEFLLNERLIACGNVLPGVTSVFRWKGRIERSTESLLLAKTTRARFERVAARVRELHSYELPAVVALPIEGGLPAYLSWVGDEIAPSAEG